MKQSLISTFVRKDPRPLILCYVYEEQMDWIYIKKSLTLAVGTASREQKVAKAKQIS